MSPDFDPLFWFVCKICRQAFRDTDKLRKHKFRKHAVECRNVKCIVFEGRLFDKKWVPSDNYFPLSNYEFINENAIEVEPLPFKCSCRCHSISTIAAETQTESCQELPKQKPNPYVSVKRLTSQELTAVLNKSSKKPVFQSSRGSNEVELTNNRDINPVDVQSENENKDLPNHQNGQDSQQDFIGDQNILVTPPEILQNSVTSPMVELDTCVSPEPELVQCASIASSSPSSSASPSHLLNIPDAPDAQNPKENEFQREIRLTVLEGEIHIELLPVKGMIEMRSPTPTELSSEGDNHVYQKSKSYNGSPPATAKEQTRNNVTKKLSKPRSHNPYVLLNRLIFDEQKTAVHQNSEKMETELFQEIVSPNKEPTTGHVFSEQEQFSAISILNDESSVSVSVNDHLDIKCDGNLQIMEENDNQLPTGTQTLELPNLSIPEVNNDNDNENETLSATNNTEQINLINNVYSQVVSLPNENEIEVICLAHNSECQCPTTSAVSLKVQTEIYLQPQPQPPPPHTPNPYVLVKRLTLEKLKCASNRPAEKPIFQSEKRKRRNGLCVNHDDVQSPSRKKKHVNHEQNQDQDQNVNPNVDVNPELLPVVVVTPNAFPEHVEISLVSPAVVDPSDSDGGNALPDPSMKCNPTVQNVEEIELEQQLVNNVTQTSQDSPKTDEIQTIEDSNNISNLALALLSLSDFRDLNKTQVTPQVNNETNEFSETNNPEPKTIITHVFYSNSECFQIEYPVSAKLPQGVRNTGEQEQLLPRCNNVIEINAEIDSVIDSEREQVLTKPLNINSLSKVNQISTSINSSQIWEDASNVADDDYTADGDEDVSENENNNDYEKPVPGSHHKLQEKDTQSSLSTPATVPHQHRMHSQKLHKKAENVALFKWLETQKKVRFSDGSRNKIYLWTERFLMSKVLGANNYIKCKLCKIKLETESKLKNHVNNCWLHNQSNHVYCIPCGRLCGSPQSLAKHFHNALFAAQHANFRRLNGPHFLDANNKPDEVHLEGQTSINDTGLHPNAPASSDKNLSILKWLEMQHKNPNNVVALEPDPLTSNRNFPNATFTISVSSPIKCKLCLQLLTSDLLLRNHVETCWSQNKSKHRYCVSCNKNYKSAFCLRQHQRYKHKNELYQKQKQESFWTCNVCHKDMEKKFLFSAHQVSLQIFRGQGSETSQDFQRKSKTGVGSTQDPYIDIPDQEGTMKNLLGWLKHIRNIPNSDGTPNLVLIDPEPTHSSLNNLGEDRDEIEISEDNPITCRLCLKKLTQIDDVKNHVQMCWSQNKGNHRYCLSCDKGFASPTELQKHKTSEHSAPKNIVLFYREADGDRSSLNVEGLEVNSENPVTCKLCETELASTPEVKIHGENCWFHNKSRHVYCTICDSRFDTANKLKCHNTSRHRNSQSCRSVEDKGESETETETEKLLPLEQWLKIQKENRNNVIALEPDPLVCETLGESSPVKCKLCQQLLTTESELRNHVKTCWTGNKAKHCYCIPCNQQFAANQYLLIHNRAKHLKYKAILPTCLKCSNEFSTESELTKHTKSLQEFLSQRKNCTKTEENANSVNTPGGPITMACMFEWLKHLRQIKNLDGTKNIILVDPEPTADNFEEFNFKNPITCRLCQTKFTTLRALKFHVQNCWSLKKENHRFCMTCDKVFETPQDLQDHSRKEHSEVARASFICKFCSQPFFHVKIFKEHQEAHKDPKFLPFQCTHCSVAFSSKKKLSQHVAALHGRLGKVAAFKCKICSKSFTTASMLNDHNRSVHTGERPFKCKFPTCNYTSYSTVTRRLHYQQKHWKELGLEAKQFLCSICGKVLTTRLGLTRHLKLIHTLKKPYKCTEESCTKDFSTNSELTEHMRVVHTGVTETPHQCEECGKSFATEWTFLKHTMGL